MIRINDFSNLERRLIRELFEIDREIELCKEKELYEQIPILKHKRKRHIEFYIDNYLKHGNDDCKKAREILNNTEYTTKTS